MRLLKIVISICFLVTILFISTSQAEMSSDNYRITSTVMSGGGGFMSSDSYRLYATLGQPSPLGHSSSTSYNLDPGFWHTLLMTLVGDVNGDGTVDLEDVITALQVVTGMTLNDLVKEADADGDGAIGLGEAVFTLQKLGE